MISSGVLHARQGSQGLTDTDSPSLALASRVLPVCGLLLPCHVMTVDVAAGPIDTDVRVPVG